MTRLGQLAGSELKEKAGTMLLGLLLVQPGNLAETCNARKFGAAGPEFESGDISGKVFISGPVGHNDGIPLLLSQRFDHPVKAFAAGTSKLHYQLRVGTIVAAQLPVIEKFDLVHMGDPPLSEKFGIDMTQIVAYRMEQLFLLLVNGNDGGAGFGGGTGGGSTGVGTAHYDHIGFQSFRNQCGVNGGRRLPPWGVEVRHGITPSFALPVLYHPLQRRSK